jgi:hypothetical protein
MNYKKTITLLFIALFLSWMALPVIVLELSNAEMNERIGGWILGPDRRFKLSHIHSVELVPVTETYSIDEQCNIYLEEIIFSSYGAGLPHTPEHPFELIPGGMRIYDMHTQIDDFVIRDVIERGRHTLRIGDTDIIFSRLAEPYTPIRIKAVRETRFYHWLREVTIWKIKTKI